MMKRQILALRIENVLTPDPGYSFEESVESSLKSGFTVCLKYIGLGFGLTNPSSSDSSEMKSALWGCSAVNLKINEFGDFHP